MFFCSYSFAVSLHFLLQEAAEKFAEINTFQVKKNYSILHNCDQIKVSRVTLIIGDCHFLHGGLIETTLIAPLSLKIFKWKHFVYDLRKSFRENCWSFEKNLLVKMGFWEDCKFLYAANFTLGSSISSNIHKKWPIF